MKLQQVRAAVKAYRLAELQQSLALAVLERDPDLRSWWQGLIHGRLLELEAFGIFSREESDEFGRLVQRRLDEKPAQGFWARDGKSDDY